MFRDSFLKNALVKFMLRNVQVGEVARKASSICRARTASWIALEVLAGADWSPYGRDPDRVPD